MPRAKSIEHYMTSFLEIQTKWTELVNQWWNAMQIDCSLVLTLSKACVSFQVFYRIGDMPYRQKADEMLQHLVATKVNVEEAASMLHTF